ncbi:Protein tyrosine phosphatase 61F [Carabus blaptoides fortunei]
MTTSSSNIETEYLELNAKNAWLAVYQHIKTESSKYNYKCLESVKPQNKNLNRYRDVSPYDHSRIVLQRGSCDYINANLVKIDKANRQYILTQGPLPETVGNFWLMVWEQKSRAVLMLNKIVEKKQVKCHWYWPQAVGPEHKMILNDVGLSLEYLEHHDHSYYSTRVFRLTDIVSNESQEILQFHYTTWPDFGVPSSPNAFLEFLRIVRESGSLDPTVGPAIIHCSAGIGRSGTFCLVDSCLVLIERAGLNSVNVKDILLEMRKYRMGLIQTPDQLRFSYLAIIEGAKQLVQPVCADIENCNSDHIESYSPSSDEDEPPPLPPPRGESLTRSYMTEGPPVDRPLPKIPNSTSLNEFPYEESADTTQNIPPSRPLPIVPSQDEEEDEEIEAEASSSEEEMLSADSNHSVTQSIRSTSPSAELRQRKRVERREQLAAQVRDMKKRQHDAEKWQQLKRAKRNED